MRGDEEKEIHANISREHRRLNPQQHIRKLNTAMNELCTLTKKDVIPCMQGCFNIQNPANVICNNGLWRRKNHMNIDVENIFDYI